MVRLETQRNKGSAIAFSLEASIVLQEAKLMLYLDRRGAYKSANICNLYGRGSVIVTSGVNVVKSQVTSVDVIYVP